MQGLLLTIIGLQIYIFVGLLMLGRYLQIIKSSNFLLLLAESLKKLILFILSFKILMYSLYMVGARRKQKIEWSMQV